ncbi:MAG: glycosyltransferase family 2 protein [Candidatus Omnitrophica bacterium]|nr:glycosyltransferase family 2 protein [Candidatus Omnitrophota bacterium]
MRLSIIVPVYNEYPTLEKVLEAVYRVDVPGFSLDKEIIAVNDGSTDGTSGILQRWKGRIIVVEHSRTEGKGACIRDGLKAASGDIVLIQDSDLEYDPADYAALLRPVISQGADVVYGSRFVGSGAHRVLYFWHYQGNRLITFLCNLFGNLNLTDAETGYKVFRKKALDSIKLKEDDFGFEVEVTLKLAKKKYRFYEVGISYYGRDYSEGKKIRWTDGVRALFLIFKYGFPKY